MESNIVTANCTITSGSSGCTVSTPFDVITTPFYGYSTGVPLYTTPSTTKYEETDNAYIHYIVLPGVKKSKVDSYIRNSYLYITVNDEDILFPSFTSISPIQLNEDTHGDVSLTLSDGILTVTIKKINPDIKLTIK